MAPPEQSKAQGLGDDEDVELVPDNCAASCVTCGQDPTSTNWPIASSLSMRSPRCMLQLTWFRHRLKALLSNKQQQPQSQQR